jgi:hypothetical protein
LYVSIASNYSFFLNILIRSQLNAKLGGGTSVSISIGGFTEATPYKKEGIDVIVKLMPITQILVT